MMTVVNLVDTKYVGEASMTNGEFLTFDGLANNKFSLIIPGLDDVSFFLQKLTLPTINVHQVNINTRVIDYNGIGEKLLFEPFIVTFMVDKYSRNWASIFNWMKSMTVNGSSVDKEADVVLMIDNKPFIRFYGAWPTSLSGYDLDSTVEKFQYVLANVSFNYDYLTYEGDFKTVDSDYL
jgi:hypothetical protein